MRCKAESVSSSKAADWFTVTPTEGPAGTATLSIRTQENTTHSDRSGSISIQAGETTQTYTITQKQQDALLATKTDYQLFCPNETISVELKTNLDVSIVIPPEHNWISPVQKNKALSTKTLQFAIEELPNHDGKTARDGIIIIQDKNSSLSDIIYITQTCICSIIIDPVPPTEEELRELMSSLQRNFSLYVENHYLFEALYSNKIEYDLIKHTPPLAEVYQHKLEARSSYVAALWQSAYTSVSSCNQIIQLADKYPQETLLSLSKNRAEIYHSWTYCKMVETWGDGVMLMTIYDPFQPPSPSSSTEAVYNFLIDKLKALESVLPESGDSWSCSKYAAKAILARIYLEKSDHANALKYANEIIQSNQYVLEPTYDDIFNTAEPKYHNADFVKYIKKRINTPAIRLAEIYLIAAESQFNLGNPTSAMDPINALRQRNGREILEAFSSNAQINGSLQEEWKNDLRHEGAWFATLKRHNNAEAMLNIESFRKILPIPNTELDFNPNASQNPGY